MENEQKNTAATSKAAPAKDTSLMHDMTQPQSSSLFSSKLILFLVFVALLGVGTGFILSKTSTKANTVSTEELAGSGQKAEVGKMYGSDDTKTFKDEAEGILKKGGFEGEGQYHLERPGGPSQFVYLTSSALDLSLFVDRKIKVWGRTDKAQKVGWLMDAGRVQVLE